MRDIKIRYIVRHKASGNIEVKHYYLNQIEQRPLKELSPAFLANYETLSRDLFTGLKDKNGKEIYKKDILEFDNRRHVVTFDNGGFGIWKDVRVDLYSNQMRKLHEPLWNLVVDECEVIGNIYEHPHLLEESK